MFADIYSLDALRNIETKAEAAAIDLMQRAAMASANWIAERYPPASLVLVAAGSGNNGGDALWAAYFLLKRSYNVSLLLPHEPKSLAAIAALNVCRQCGLQEIGTLNKLHVHPDILLDGLFGIGLNRGLSNEWIKLIRELNALKVPTLALDTPSGLDAYRGVIYGEAIHASATLTFLCAKPGLYTADGADYSGKVFVDTLDLPASLAEPACGALNICDTQALLRKKNTHKGSFGSVCVVGGANGMLGAALLSGRAALSGGAGKVYVATLEHLSVDVCAPELMLLEASQAFELGVNTYVIGPGLSKSSDALKILLELLATQSKKVMDADALNLMAKQPNLRQIALGADSIITPHPAEAARLLQTDIKSIQADRVKAALELAKRFGCVVILKGSGSIIAKPDGFYRVNISGNAALASAGQGDVLSGICGAFLAQGMSAFDAACLAVNIHGQAADDYVAEQGGTLGLSASSTIKRMTENLCKLSQAST